MSSYEADLIRRARELQRLVTKRRRLKRNLRAVEAEIRHARKLLKAIQLASEDRRPDVMPNRLDAGVTGFPLPDRVRQTSCRLCGLDIENFAPFPAGQWRDRGNNTRCNLAHTTVDSFHEPEPEA